MQSLVTELENRYQMLLNQKEFQENFTCLFNHLASMPFTPYKGLPRNIILEQPSIKLYHYLPLKSPSSLSPPLLIVYAFINRSTILDLQEDRSFIQKLLVLGLDVYLLDWTAPRLQDAQNPLSHYIQQIRYAIKTIPSPKVNLLGICQGGTLSLCATALSQKKLASLITMVTPVDFQTTLLTGLLKKIDTLAWVKQRGNVPGVFLSVGLQSLKPFRFLKIAETDRAFFLRMEQWMQDCPDHPGFAFHDFVSQFYQKNNLARGQYYVENKRIDLSTIRLPILNIYAERDHLVPTSAANALKALTGSLSYEEYCFSGGHIGVFVSQKALENIPRKICEFIARYS